MNWQSDDENLLWRLSYTWSMIEDGFARGELTAFLEITNIYNQRNPCCAEYQLQTDVSGDQTLIRNEGNWLPLMPSLGVIWQF